MAAWDLPRRLEVGGAFWEVRSDFRDVLTLLDVLGDPDATDDERAYVALSVFYPAFGRGEMPYECAGEAGERMMWFIRGGSDDEGPRRPRLMDWSQDFPLIVGPVNRVAGYEIRSCEYMHWWTFLSLYQEIGDCLFAQVVSIRQKLARGTTLDKADRRFLAEHRDIITLRTRMSAEEEALIDEWTK